jgi:hypothetical protein
MMYEVKCRKLMNKKGRALIIKKTSRRELIAIKQAFVAGACIAGSLLYSDCANLFLYSVASKFIIT